LIRWENTRRLKKLFSPELAEETGLYNGYEQVRESLPEAYGGADSLTRAQYLEMSIFLSNYLLSCQGDRVAMAHSLEIRLPFLDPRVIDFMGRVPSKWKILGLNEKYILKKSFEQVLPPEITGRSKHPYRAPIKQSLLNRETEQHTREMLSEGSLKKAGLFDAEKVTRLMQKLHRTDHTSEIDNMALVGILSSQLIHQQFIEDFPVEFAHSGAPGLIVDRRSEAPRSAN